MGKSVLDTYAQFAYAEVTLDAATAAGSESVQLVTGLSNLQKVAWAVERVEFYLEKFQVEAAFSTSGNHLMAYWSQSNVAPPAFTPTDIASLASTICARGLLTCTTAGASIEASVVENPLVVDFPSPMLFLPQLLYFKVGFIRATPAAMVIGSRIHYKEIELGPEDWYDLLQLRLPLGATV